jgi:hypothetical protein
VLVNLPLALIGGIMAIYATASPNLIVIPAGYETMERLLGTDPDDLAKPTIASAYTNPSEEPHTPEDEPNLKNS